MYGVGWKIVVVFHYNGRIAFGNDLVFPNGFHKRIDF
jgi:hypothetical protein